MNMLEKRFPEYIQKILFLFAFPFSPSPFIFFSFYFCTKWKLVLNTEDLIMAFIKVEMLMCSCDPQDKALCARVFLVWVFCLFVSFFFPCLFSSVSLLKHLMEQVHLGFFIDMIGVLPQTPLALSDFLDGRVNSVGVQWHYFPDKHSWSCLRKKREKKCQFLSHKEITDKFSSIQKEKIVLFC